MTSQVKWKLTASAQQVAHAQADNGHATGVKEKAVEALEDPPSLIADAPGLQIWHKLDRTFKRPIALAYLCITPRFAYDSARTAALTHLALKLLQDDVNEAAYLADVAGLGYDVRSSSIITSLRITYIPGLPGDASEGLGATWVLLWHAAKYSDDYLLRPGHDSAHDGFKLSYLKHTCVQCLADVMQ